MSPRGHVTASPRHAAPAAAHDFVPGSDGPHIVLPEGQSDVELRSTLAPYAHVRLLRVGLGDSSRVLRCVERDEEARRQATLKLLRVLT